MRIKVYILNSFAKLAEGGNPAGVVLNADELSFHQMQNIAKRVGFSETAFVQKTDLADFKVRFFTPNMEVDLCGHATIATFYLLKNLGIIGSGVYRQETKAGILNIQVEENNRVFMDQSLPLFLEKLDPRDVLDALNISHNDLIADLPIQIVSTGLKDILVPVKSLQTLLSLKPNFAKIAQVSKKHDVVGFHAFTLETMFNSTAHCRNFAPLYEIPEESATGTSNGALGCYLFQHGLVDKQQVRSLVFEQGYSMSKPSEILVKLDADDGIKAVKVGGEALLVDEIEFE